jgi:predicted O-methyltransferase YrrM
VEKYKFYFRKSSFKKDIKNGIFLLNLISQSKPKNFLEIGVLEGVTSRNVCELLNKINNGNFSFTGIDLFGTSIVTNNEKEFTPISYKISNPLKWIYFRLILRMSPNSAQCVKFLLNKFKNSTKIYKGYSKEILNQINLKKIDFVFLDGGHSYDTVKDDLKILTTNLNKNSIIICDDYNILHYGVKKAVDEIKDNYIFKDLGRFAYLRKID